MRRFFKILFGGIKIYVLQKQPFINQIKIQWQSILKKQEKR